MSAVAMSVPSMVDTFHDRGPTMLSDRPSMLSDSPSMLSDSPSMLSSAPSMIESRGSYTDRPSMIADDNNKPESDEDSLVSPDDLVNHSQKQITSSKRGKRKKYQKYTPEDRFAIGKYCFEHGPAAARKAFQERYPEMSESVTRGFRDKYKMIIGESAVYEFEQRRRRELNKRTAPLPRGRPRKYKPVEFDDDLPATMVPRSITPPTPILPRPAMAPLLIVAKSTTPPPLIAPKQTVTSPLLVTRNSTPPLLVTRNPMSPLPVTRNPSPPLSMTTRRLSPVEIVKETKNTDAQNGAEKILKVKNYSTKHITRIGKMCAQDGIHATRSQLEVEFPELTDDLILNFHKKYLESEGVLTQPQVFILEGGDSVSTTLKTMATATSITTQSDMRQRYDDIVPSSFQPTDSRAVHSINRDYALVRERSFDEQRSISMPAAATRENGFRSPQPVHTLSRPVSSVGSGTRVTGHASPIIHYPKVHSEVEYHYRSIHETRGIKREYSSAMETDSYGGGGYPYDRHTYDRRPTEMSNGVNDIVNNETASARAKRFKYQKYTPEDRYNIGKLCNDIGLGATVKVYREQFPRLNESVVRTFRNKYRELLQKGNGTPTAEAIERKPSRRSISSLIENEVVSQLRQFKISQIELSPNLVIAVSENVIASKDPRETAGMKAMINKEWANSLLWKHKLIEKPAINTNNVCCERCKCVLVCPKCN